MAAAGPYYLERPRFSSYLPLKSKHENNTTLRSVYPESVVISIAYLCNSAPAPMAEALISEGCRVYEALAISEVLYLCEHHDIDAVVIAADVEDSEIAEAQMRHVC